MSNVRDLHNYDDAIAATRQATEQGVSEADLEKVYDHVWARLAERRPRSRAVWLVPIFAGAFAAAVIAVLLLKPAPVTRPELPLRVVASTGAGGLEAESTTLGDDSDLALGEGMQMRLALGDEAEAFVVGPAHLRFVKREPRVASGTVAFSVTPRAKGMAPYRVRIGYDEVVVHGTKFVVFAADESLRQVSVREGVVEVKRGGAAGGQFLRAGDAFVANSAATADADKVWATLEGRLPTKDPVVAPAPDITSAKDDKLRPRVERPKSDLWAAATASLRAKRCNALKRQVDELVHESTSAEDKAQAELLDAECAVRAGSKREAVGLYESIVRTYPDTVSAETALFEIATLQSTHGGSLAAVEAYLQRYPKGRFTDATSFRRCELLIQLSRLPEARQCLDRYRQDFPSGQRTPASLLLLATLSRINQSWQDAAGLYAQYAATTSEKAEEALYYRVVCLKRGSLPGVEQAADDYLQRFPEGPHAQELRQK